jgi:hypothetical protein
MDEHLLGRSMRRGERSCPTVEYRQTARRTVEYRLVGGGTAECRQPAGGLARGGAGGDRATRGREGGICDEKVGFVCSLAKKAGLSPLFSRPESPSAPRGAGDGLSSPDGWRPKSKGNEEPGARLGRITPSGWKKRAVEGLVGAMAGDDLTIPRGKEASRSPASYVWCVSRPRGQKTRWAHFIVLGIVFPTRHELPCPVVPSPHLPLTEPPPSLCSPSS